MQPESCLLTRSTPAVRRSDGRDNGPVATWPLWPLASVVTVTVPDLGCPALVLVRGQLAEHCRSSDGVVETVSSRPPDSRQRTPHLHTALPGHLATWRTNIDTFAWTQTIHRDTYRVFPNNKQKLNWKKALHWGLQGLKTFFFSLYKVRVNVL